MDSMYETIMQLPLFKGIGTEQLSALLEKTSVEFIKFNPGEALYKTEQRVMEVDFILRGKVKRIFRLNNYPITVEEIVGEGNVLGALNLFGMDNFHTSQNIALERVDIMRIHKADYLNILQSDHIYLLNYLNYLSAAAQKYPESVLNSRDPGIGRTLHWLASSVATRVALYIAICGTTKVLADFCGVEQAAFEDWIAKNVSSGKIKAAENRIIVKSPD